MDTYPLLFHARDKATDIVADTPENRRKGWKRIALFALYFRPSVLDVPKWGEVFHDAAEAPKRGRKNYFGLYPFKWKDNWQRCFEALRGDGRLFVAPILQTLILNRAPKETITWAEQIASWDFTRIIPCHFDAPIEATANQFRQAFSFLEKHSGNTLPQEDFQVLEEIDTTLNKLGIPSAKEKV